ncbi:MAG: hypothetical protein ACLR2C_10005 [Parasutterella excrementihominis]
MKNNGNFKNAGSSRAKTWRNILLILGAVALIASYIADIVTRIRVWKLRITARL